MKYIFDFDDVLFKNTEMLKPRIFRFIAEAGINEEIIKKDYYRPEVRGREFSLREFIRRLFDTHQITNKDPDQLYEDIMKECHRFLNVGLVQEIKKIGKENCYIVTNGDQAFNRDKLRYSGILEFFDLKNIHIVPGTKKDKIKEICDENKNSQIVFIDDKSEFTKDISLEDCPNLSIIVYKGEKLGDLIKKIHSREKGELRRIK